MRGRMGSTRPLSTLKPSVGIAFSLASCAAALPALGPKEGEMEEGEKEEDEDEDEEKERYVEGASGGDFRVAAAEAATAC